MDIISSLSGNKMGREATTALYRLSHLKPSLCSKYYFPDFKMRKKKLSPGKPLNTIPFKFPVRLDVTSAQGFSMESCYLLQSKDHSP